MAIPYNTTNAGTNVREALRHSSIKVGGGWNHLEDIQVKVSGAWRDTKEVWVKSGGTWRLVHEGEHFLFKHDLNTNSSGNFDLAGWVSNFYGGNKVKGLLTVTSNKNRQQVNLGNFSSDSLIYLRLESGARIQGHGGNGGNATGAGVGSGPNGQNGQRALYTRTAFILDNGGMIAGGGGGGDGGNNTYHQYNQEQSYPCQKGETCYTTNQNQDFKAGGGGGGGAGYPGGNGGLGGSNNYNGQNGNQNNGGSGGDYVGGSASHAGGDGGGIGNNGQNATGGGSPGQAGVSIDGWNKKINSLGSGNGDIRGPTANA